MPLCAQCGKPCASCNAPQPLGNNAVPCAKDKGAVWVRVMDDAWNGIEDVEIELDGRVEKTDDSGFVLFDPLDPRKHQAEVKDTAGDLARDYDLPRLIEDAWVADGEITYLAFKLTRKAELTVEVKSEDGTKPFENAKVKIAAKGGPGNAEKPTLNTGIADFGRVSPAEYSIEVELEANDAKDFFVEAEPSFPILPGQKRATTLTAKPINVVTPKIDVEYKVVLFDRGLTAHQRGGEAPILPDTTFIEVSFSETHQASCPYEGGGKLTFTPDNVDAYLDAACDPKDKLAGDLTKDQLEPGKKLKLWLKSKARGRFTAELELKDPNKGLVKIDPPAREDMGVVEVQGKLFRWNTANPPVMDQVSDRRKVRDGRYLHLQNLNRDHARAKLVLHIDPAEWPPGTDDYEILVTDQSTDSALALFDDAWAGAPAVAHAFPYKVKKSVLAGGDKTLWVQGKARSVAERDGRLDVGLVSDPGPEKKGGDWARFTVLQITKVAPKDQFAAPSADYALNNKYRVPINIQADGHKIKVKASILPKIEDLRLYFMLAADENNGLPANTGVAVPAELAPWTWDQIDRSFKKTDKAADTDHFHLSALTDAAGEAEVELELSKIGGDVFHAGAYIHQDQHLATFKHGDPVLGVRKPLLSKKITVWRKLWYQLCRATTCGAPTPDHSVAAYERLKVQLTEVATKQIDPPDVAGFTGNTFYPEWMVKPGGGDDMVAVVGNHNWREFRNDEATFFPPGPGEVTPLKACILVGEYQWDWRNSDGQFMTELKTFKIEDATSAALDMGAMVVKPALTGNLILTGTWKVIKRGLIERTVAQGTLAEGNILITKPRTSLNKIKIRLPAAAANYVRPADTSGKYKVKVQLKLASAQDFLGESDGRHILAVYDSTDVNDYKDTISHELGHSLHQTPRSGRQPGGMPAHEYWNRGQGVHCANPTALVGRRSPSCYPGTKRAARLAATCIMFEQGPVPSANNRFCDLCHHYMLAQDMSSLT